MEYFPKIDNFDDETLHRMGYYPVRVSILDHWLSEDEARASCILSYNEAERSGNLSTFYNGENRFISFYRFMSKGGIILKANYEKESLEQLLFDDAMPTIIASLREQELMDLFFLGSNIRVLGGYDRTDLALVFDSATANYVRDIAINCGLFVLQ